MPHSSRRSLTRIRKTYTGESSVTAVVPARGKSLGLDFCSPAQRSLRAMLFLFLMNCGPDRSPYASEGAAAITVYKIMISPQPGDLRIITNAPTNVAGRLLGRRDDPAERKGILGMRLVAATADPPNLLHRCTYQLRYLPTGATITVTRDKDQLTTVGQQMLTRLAQSNGWPDPSLPMTSYETAWQQQLPSPSPDAEMLFAGITARLTLRDPRKHWAVGNFDSYPFRLHRPDLTQGFLPDRSLHGAGDNWALAWQSYPYPDDLIMAVTDSVAGLSGASYTDGHLRLGAARLALRHLPELSPEQIRQEAAEAAAGWQR